MTRELTTERRKTVIDETSFQKLLAAAYVLQQHTDRLSGNEPTANPTRILSEIVEIQKLAEAQALGVRDTSQIIAGRLHKITTATGVAIGIVDEDKIHYLAAVGNSYSLADARIPIENSLSADSLRNGKLAFGLRDSQNILRSFPRGKNNSESFMSIPFQHHGSIAGALELKFGQASAIPESDISAAQLMAGLMSDAIARSDSKPDQFAPQASQHEAPETSAFVHPESENFPGVSPESFLRIGEEPDNADFVFDPPAASFPAEGTGLEQSPKAPADQPAMDPICHSCGHHFRDDEFFCGTCGLTRFVAESATGGLQSKWASLWYLQRTHQASELGKTGSIRSTLGEDYEGEPKTRGNEGGFFEETISSVPEPGLSLDYPQPDWSVSPYPVSQAAPSAAAAEAIHGNSLDAVYGPPAEVIASAGNGSGFDSSYLLDQPDSGGMAKLWQAHRSEAYLAIAAVFLIVALTGWGKTSLETSSPAATSAARRKHPPKPKLTAFEQLLVGVGLAEPPPAPVYEGNPDTQVWIDLHTALYYCPGSELFGTTSRGQMTTQRSAQLDQFQPADRKPCD